MLQYTNPQYLSRIWHLVKPGIEEILEDLNKECLQELWVPEDVWSSIRLGESILWMSDEGFVITQVRQDKFTGQRQFFVWMGYSYNPDNNVLNNNQIQLEQIARANQCELISFSSNRRGFLKKAKEMGYAIGPTTYVKRI